MVAALHLLARLLEGPWGEEEAKVDQQVHELHFSAIRMMMICLANHLGLDRLLLGIFVPATLLILFSAGWFPDRAGPGQLVQR